MAGLLEGKIAKAIFKGFKGRLLKGTLRRDTDSTTLDSLGDATSTTKTEFSIEGFTDEFEDLYRVRAGIPETDLKVNIFAESSPGLVPEKDDRVTFQSKWYQLRKIKIDPAGALYECQAFQVPAPTD